MIIGILVSKKSLERPRKMSFCSYLGHLGGSRSMSLCCDYPLPSCSLFALVDEKAPHKKPFHNEIFFPFFFVSS